MQIYVTFDSDVGLAEQLINPEVILFGIGSPNENGQLFVVRPKFHRGPHMDQLLYRLKYKCFVRFAAVHNFEFFLRRNPGPQF